MKKTKLLNAPLSRIVAAMGHGDLLVIADSGLPIPRGKELVDLALTRNIPRSIDVLEAVLTELKIEKAIIANEAEEKCPAIIQEFTRMLQPIPLSKISHENFKKLTRETTNIAFVRTGEATPFANLILISGVTF